MLRVSLSIILLAVWTVATPVARSADNDQIETLTIKGSVTYEAGAELPPGSRAVIELRHLPALPGAPSVVEQRIDLEGKQSPVPFEFTLGTLQTHRERDVLRARRSRLREACGLDRRRHQDRRDPVHRGRERDHAEAGKPVEAGAPVLDSAPR